MIFSQFNSFPPNVPIAYYLLVMTINYTMASMSEVKTIGKKQAKEDGIKPMLDILGVVFAFHRLLTILRLLLTSLIAHWCR